ncbi:RIP metalloprotease RseP [Companilactobacillus alimentarius]|uniref:Zinc metalloprotease n=1 Tax=Companilactobacillus alimentarius DSM 20249 TaxID=1423720 RepID=A0A2K9HFN5_9LACO|nr:RIP metalloprotease RseP [Companilactobacillus alimentarius]AUI71374.1 RIP metalloprotease RseP [Companilactobacillus alimentarius DSM 20249]KRK74727.1 membrane-associated zinc metalloendopeptidase [Companilactobacillus alimentarius DSM 20249]MDT6951303.1 RIP metalloprotease RseP [Companilactobacillus alimentarius]GEO44360.1 zinc metalloprotease [Companilactobacillus alimentarius]
MTAIITFIIVFGILVIVHEFGHYYAAKKSGILVREFSVGMGPKIVAYRKNHTTYTLRLLPLGGYVRMAGAQEDDSDIQPGTMASLVLNNQNKVTKIITSSKVYDANAVPVQISKSDLVDDLEIEGYENGDESVVKKYSVDHDATIVEEDGTEVQIAPRDVQLQSVSVWKRMITNFAGPFNNFILAVLAAILAAFMMNGVATNQLGHIEKNSIAQQAGLKVNDTILSVNGKSTGSWTALSTNIQNNPGKRVSLKVKSSDKVRTVKLTPKSVKSQGQSFGFIGIMPKRDSSIGAKIKYGFSYSWGTTVAVFHALGKMVSGGFNINQLSGPVGIYSMTSQVASQGLVNIILFTSMLSMNLGIVNLIPIPALDGGKILLNIVEAIRRKPIPEQYETVITLIGVGILVLLMIAVTWNDIQRFFIK